MALDLIKEYLVGIGFKVDSNSLSDTEKSIGQAESKLNEFNKNSNKGFSETSESLKNLFSLFNTSGIVENLLPGLRGPLQGFVKDISSVKKAYTNYITSTSKASEKTHDSEKTYKSDEANVSNLTESFQGLITNIVIAKKLYNEFLESVVKANKEVSHDTEIFKDGEVKVNEFRLPFLNIIEDVAALKGLYNEFIESVEGSKESAIGISDCFKIEKDKASEKYISQASNKSELSIDVPEKQGKNISNPVTSNVVTGFDSKNSHNPFSNIKENISNLKSSIESFATGGAKSIKTFAMSSISHMALLAAGIAGTVLMVKKLVQGLGDLANQQIEYEKLSRQLWTTVDVAKDVDSALKTLGVTMQDLWLSPTLLKQFNQLRKDSQNLRLPAEFKENIKVVQGIGLEFKRLKQLISLTFQWIGHYILKYCAGPLSDIKNGINKFNNSLIKSIPHIAKVIGTAIGVVLKIILAIFEVLGFIFNIMSKIGKFIGGLLDKIPKPLKEILLIVGMLGLAILSGPLGAILLIVAVIDDLLTFFRGGKSVIGDVFDFFKNIGSGAIEKVKESFGKLKNTIGKGIDAIKDGWNSYWEKAKDTFDKIADKAKTVWGNIKEWGKGVWDNTKDFFSGIGDKVTTFFYGDDSGEPTPSTTPQSYLHNNNTSNSTTNNNNNNVNSTNTINVYGTDAKSTANEVNKNLTGINTRNFQGVIG